MQEDMRMFLWLISEITLIPDGPLIVEERFALCIPVARHLQRGRLRKVILHHSAARLLLLVAAVARESAEVWIDNRVPIAVERRCRPHIRTGKHNRRRLGDWRALYR